MMREPRPLIDKSTDALRLLARHAIDAGVRRRASDELERRRERERDQRAWDDASALRDEYSEERERVEYELAHPDE